MGAVNEEAIDECVNAIEDVSDRFTYYLFAGSTRATLARSEAEGLMEVLKAYVEAYGINDKLEDFMIDYRSDHKEEEE